MSKLAFLLLVFVVLSIIFIIGYNIFYKFASYIVNWIYKNSQSNDNPEHLNNLEV